MANYDADNEFEGIGEDDIVDESQYPKLNYDDVKIDEPPRKDKSGNNYDPAASMSSALDDMKHKSDVQAIVEELTPVFNNKILNDLVQPAMVSRVQPDNVIDADKQVVISMLESFDEDEAYKFDPTYAILSAHNAHMIGYKGMGRADLLEAAGAVREEEMEKLSKGLGL